jgi:hypothetical protein
MSFRRSPTGDIIYQEIPFDFNPNEPPCNADLNEADPCQTVQIGPCQFLEKELTTKKEKSSRFLVFSISLTCVCLALIALTAFYLSRTSCQCEILNVYHASLDMSKLNSTSSPVIDSTEDTALISPRIIEIHATTETPTSSSILPETTSTQTTSPRKLNDLCSSLVNYWPLENGTARDLIRGMDLLSKSPDFTTDRFQNENGALRLKTGNESTAFWQAPVGDYFTNQLSITYWFRARPFSKFNAIGSFCKMY